MAISKHDEMKNRGIITGCSCNDRLGKFNSAGSISNDWLVLYYEFKKKTQSNYQSMITTYSGYSKEVKTHILNLINDNNKSKETDIFTNPDKFKLADLKEYATKYGLEGSTKKELISAIK